MIRGQMAAPVFAMNEREIGRFLGLEHDDVAIPSFLSLFASDRILSSLYQSY